NGAASTTRASAANSGRSTDKANPRSSTAPSPSAASPGASAKSPRSVAAESGGIVKDDPKRVAEPGAELADAVAKRDAMEAARTAHRPLVNREQDGVALAERHNGRTRLHARALFRQHELASGEIL